MRRSATAGAHFAGATLDVFKTGEVWQPQAG